MIGTFRYDPTSTPADSFGLIDGGGFQDIRSFANRPDIRDINYNLGRAMEGIAVSSSLVTSRPLPGDKFSININVAEFEGKRGRCGVRVFSD